MKRRGPGDIAKAARVIIEGMKGEPLDEEIDDVMTDAIWDAFVAGKESVAAKPKRARPAGRSTSGTALVACLGCGLVHERALPACPKCGDTLSKRAPPAPATTPPDADDATCVECGYSRGMHRAYGSIDGGGKELGAYLGGRWHPFRASAVSPSSPGGET